MPAYADEIQLHDSIYCLIPALFRSELIRQLPQKNPALDKIASRGQLSITNPRGMQELLESVSVMPLEVDFPIAAATIAGLEGDACEGNWALLEPVHFRADRDRLLLFPLDTIDDNGLVDLDLNIMVDDFNQHFANDGCSFLYRDGYWFVRFDHAVSVKTVSLAPACALGLDSAMPTGDDAAFLRRMLNELQMLLHQQVAIAESRPLLNGFWISGVGSLEALNRSSVTCNLVGESALFRGIRQYKSLDAEDVTNLSAPAIVEMDAMISGDLTKADQFIAKLLNAVSSGRAGGIAVADESGHCVRMTHYHSYRFWRRGNWQQLIASLDEHSSCHDVPILTE